ncbi:MAG: chloride channel protein [Gemmatimonadales bacterium]
MTTGARQEPVLPMGPLPFGLLGVLVGVVAGFGAVLFRGLIGLVHNVLFLGQFSLQYDANTHTPESPWGALVILVPVVGAVGVAYLVKTFAPEAKGHGVPEVMDAIHYRSGIIRPIVAVVKSLASALSIGSGGSVGREGPIIQIGSSFGASLAKLLRVPRWQRIVLIACGAGGGIAATFNTPIGGVLFVVEILLVEVSVRTLVPVVLATVTATYIGQVFLGAHPSFVIPGMATPYYHLLKPHMLPAYLGLGVLMGLASTLFIRTLYAFEDFFTTRVKGSYYRQHLLGMLAVGLMIYGFMAVFGHYYIEGVGYATVQDILSDQRFSLGLMLLLFGGKLLATSLTLGSGASGGIFSPALFLGATLGAAYGIVLHMAFPGIAISTPAFAVAGMAGMIGGSTGAAVAAIVMILEMTLDYSVVVPMTAVVAVSYGVRSLLCRDSIYAMKLSRRGRVLPTALRAATYLGDRAQAVMETRIGRLRSEASADEMAAGLAVEGGASFFLVTDQHRVVGFLTADAICRAAARGPTTAGAAADRRFATVTSAASMEAVMGAMRAAGATVALVTGRTGPFLVDTDVEGVVTAQQLAQAMLDEGAFFLDA